MAAKMCDRWDGETVSRGHHLGCLDSALMLALLERAANTTALHLECKSATTVDETLTATEKGDGQKREHCRAQGRECGGSSTRGTA